MSIYTDALQKLIDEIKIAEIWMGDPFWHGYDTGYIDGLKDALHRIERTEKELEQHLLLAFEEYGVPFT